MDVKILITCLKKMGKMSCIQNFNLLIEALQELDDIVEMDDIKSSIVTQIKFLLVNIEKDQKTNRLDNHMVHTVLSGPPGSGKTKIGNILAKIWTSFGLLKKPTFENTKEDISKIKTDILLKDSYIRKLENSLNFNKIILKSALCDIEMNKYRLESLKGQMNLKNTDQELSIPIINQILDTQKIYKDRILKITENTIPEPVCLIDIDNQIDEIIDFCSDEASNKEELLKDASSELIKVVSREDFVGGFLGQSALKTEKLLRDNMGKVIFIDEAYSLVNDDKDSYGKEALTVINRYMSEYSDSIIIIFAGYKNLIKYKNLKI